MVVLLSRGNQRGHPFGDPVRQEARHSVAHLVILSCPIALEEVVVRKALQARSLSNCQTATLQWISVDEVVPVLGYVACYRTALCFDPLHVLADAKLSQLQPLCRQTSEPDDRTPNPHTR